MLYFIFRIKKILIFENLNSYIYNLREPGGYDAILYSKILMGDLAFKLIKILNKKHLYMYWKLVYRGSRDGFKVSDFFNKFDNKLTIIKSTSGNVFGGYTTPSYCDTYSFLFSLVNKDKKNLIFNKSNNNADFMEYNSANGSYFGGLNDLVISDYANLNTDSYSDLGSYYTHPDYPKGTEKAKCILAGSFNFKISEIEIYAPRGACK